MSVCEGRRRAIERFRGTLTDRPYRGYDVLVVSSSMLEEAAVRQAVLETAFRGVVTGNDALGNEVCILSVCDESQGGQIIGQAITWARAARDFAAWSATRGLGPRDLDELVRTGTARVAIYHNGGKGERASPATQSLGNSRGSQKLVGTVLTAEGIPIELDLMLAVVLQTAQHAPAASERTIDTWWGNQIAFGSNDPETLPTPQAALSKFLIAIDRANPSEKDLYDYGTARLDESGRIVGFLANKKLARPRQDGGYEPNPEHAAAREALWAAAGAAYDFGSFRMRHEMHEALVEYWGVFRDLFGIVERTGRSPLSRDIDPALVQMLVPLASGLDRLAPGALDPLAPAPALRDAARRGDRGDLEAARRALAERLGAECRQAMSAAAAGRTEYIEETLEFFLLYRDREAVFGPRARHIGAIDLGAGSHWFAYKRLMDIGNEKFLMLGDLVAEPFAIEPDGSIGRGDGGEDGRIIAADARAFRGIADDAVAVFRHGGAGFRIGREESRAGVSIVGGRVLPGDVEGAAVYVQGSVIQGGTVLHDGSRVVACVVNGSEGCLQVDHAYVEGTLAPVVRAHASVLHRVVCGEAVEARGELVTDAFRPAFRAPGRHPGQARLRVPVGYDPKNDGETRDESGTWTFREIREMPCAKAVNDVLEARCRAAAREAISGGTRPT